MFPYRPRDYKNSTYSQSLLVNMLKEWGNNKLLVNLSVALLFLLFASAVTWPLLISPDPHDHADTLFNTWLIHWNNFAIFSGNNPVNQPIFEGFQDADGRNDFLLAQSTVAIPFQLLGVNPVIQSCQPRIKATERRDLLFVKGFPDPRLSSSKSNPLIVSSTD